VGLLCTGLLFDVAALGLDAAALASEGWTRKEKWLIWEVRGEEGHAAMAMKHHSRSARWSGALWVILPVAHGGGDVLRLIVNIV
jgi:hypothetical protein